MAADLTPITRTKYINAHYTDIAPLLRSKLKAAEVNL